MFTLFFSSLGTLRSCFQTRAALHLENLALRHQINILRRAQRGRVHLTSADRLFWTWLMHLWSGWRSAVAIVKPETVIAWHRKGFRLYWTWKSRQGRLGRSEVSREIRELIREMSLANPLWGAPRIHGEIAQDSVSKSAKPPVAKYMARQRKPPSQTWRAFLNNHVQQLVSTDFFVVPTVTFRVLYVFIVLAHDRRRLLHFNVTAHPTAEWTAKQMVEAFPWDKAPRYLLHDRDSIYEGSFRQRVRGMGIREVLTAPRSPGQNP